ncbi:GAF domain-containing protein [Flammeovirga kamogawensis]|uniref:histidine kinase n=1 Tax=Flammeovirga kamogawensis TaxID=373891 RepID=A0ABX8GT30_9BACT|nr:GAF domain-containing protein [Flammeovirga kamogawensis]MBB6462908.1 HAMP domain-containing protein/GAF domain-containing protein [Flammeovirga kamogawensis]QWG06437.1 GAF domain-containing protein [Flammeovirga kamogawensis]TRX68268.1 HAMP domain-containing protein [Flammeovirga kamogawensis]
MAEKTSTNTKGSGLRLNDLSIRVKVLLNLLLIAALSSTAVGMLGYYSAKKSLEEAVFAQLTSVREVKRRTLESFIEDAKEQVSVLAQSRMVSDAVMELSPAFSILDYYYAPGKIERMRRDLKEFYRSDVDRKLGDNDDGFSRQLVNSVDAVSDRMVILQTLYLSNNPNPIGKKFQLNRANDKTAYSDIHERYHSSFRRFLMADGFSDLLLVNVNSSEVIYSVSKNVDFGSNLMDGVFRQSALGQAFTLARNSIRPNMVILSDFGSYEGSYGDLQMFFSAPVYEEGEKIAVLIATMPLSAINKIMTDDGDWVEEGLGRTGETYLVGKDQLMRSDARLFEEDAERFYKQIRDLKIPSEEIRKIKALRTTVLSKTVNTAPIQDAMKGHTGNMLSVNYLGEPALTSYTSLKIRQLPWMIVAEMQEVEAFESIERLKWNVALATIIIFIIGFIVSNAYSANFTRPILKLEQAISKLARGDVSTSIPVKSADEIGKTIESMNSLIERTKQTSDFASDIGKGNFKTNFDTFGNRDVLGNSLIKMRDRLEFVSEEDHRRQWVSEGISKFAEITRKYLDDVDQLYSVVLRDLVDYLSANQGMLFLVEDDLKSDTQFLQLKSCYAFDRDKYLNKQIGFGEGLAGRCWQENESLFIDDVPPGYSKIVTGLGLASPKSLLLVPLKFNEEALGVIELASFNVIEPYMVEFIERVSESIASAITSAKHNTRTSHLLSASQKLTQELRVREEEMLQNTEELQATQEEMERRQQELEEVRRSLQKEIAMKDEQILFYKSQLGDEEGTTPSEETKK